MGVGVYESGKQGYAPQIDRIALRINAQACDTSALDGNPRVANRSGSDWKDPGGAVDGHRGRRAPQWASRSCFPALLRAG